MSTPRFGRIQKASALLPLAALSVAWTASLAGVGVTTTAASADENPPQVLPDGTSVPAQAIEAPASVSVPGRVAPAISGDASRVVATASTSGIPSAALAAYQRAETVINSADKTCNLPWQLVAAIGRVESDHGRTNGNHLDDKGIARPGIFGIALDGTHNTTRIKDTDAGQYDADAKFDRAVGPMQFIPSTWSVVGVDADGDGQRNPQDVNDAALATSVYLCSGDDDLSTTRGQRSAVFRYNHSSSYVDLVLSIMQAYMSGDFTAVPNGTTSAGYFVPDTSTPPHPVRHHQAPHPHATPGGGSSTTPANPPATQPSNPPAPQPSSPPSNPTNPGGGTPTLPVPVPTTLPPLPTPSVPPVDEVLTLAQATAQCLAEGLIDNPLSSTDAFDKCVSALTGN